MERKDEKWLLEEKYGGIRGDAFDADVARLRAGEPLTYVIGFIPFLGLRIHLGSKPLIPRPETEWWCEQLISHLIKPGGTQNGAESNNTIYSIIRLPGRQEERLKILDLCAGSGAVGCALLKHVPGATVSFGEIDPAHEATIRMNIDANGLDASRADARIGDLFAPFEGDKFDVIATNPPYIPESRALDASVDSHEPEIALRSGADGLDLIRRIASEAPAHLNPGGELWMEVDSDSAEEARELVAEHAKRAEAIPDQFDVPRLVVGYY